MQRARPWLLHGAIVAYLAIQIALPVRGLLVERLDDRGAFSWNMFSYRRECIAGFARRTPDGLEAVDPRRWLKKGRRRAQLWHRNVLPHWNEFLCEQLPGERLEAYVACRIDDGPLRPLIRPGTAICEAPNFGVVPRR